MISNKLLKNSLSYTGMALDSRLVKPGYLFAALPGSKLQGTDYIHDAVARGARTILAPTGYQPSPDDLAKAEFIFSDTPRKTLAELAREFYKTIPETIFAVTGTNGKTSVAEYGYQILNLLGVTTCCLSTISIKPEEGAPDLPKTWTSAPDTISTYQVLDHYGANGFTHATLEATSHGLDQYRIWALPIKVAGFTNLTEDHLDYHGTMQNYFEAKWRLFSEYLADDGVAVFNAEAEIFSQVKTRLSHLSQRIITYGTPESDLYASDSKLKAFGKTYEVNWPFPLPFQISNLLCAVGMVHGLGFDVEKIIPLLKKLKPVQGRMELVATLKNGAKIFIDYAHTGDGMMHVLSEARKIAPARVNVLFGAGGNRPISRRTGMGKVAQELADKVYVTDDNPRHEDPAKIRADILKVCPKGIDCPDRAKGIAKAISDLEAEDILLLCGKGHETGMSVGDQELPYSEHEVVRGILKNL